jgi:hypothetical protein
MAGLAKLFELMESDRGIARWRAYKSIPCCLPPTHARRVLAVIARRMKRERHANVRSLLRDVATRVREDCLRAP